MFTPHEREKLLLAVAGMVARDRLQRGVKLNHPEATAIIATQIMEWAREGRSLTDIVDLGGTILSAEQVMSGVPAMIPSVQVEATFPDGTKLVTVHHPIVAEHGDHVLALYGSFLEPPAPVPATQAPATGRLASATAGPPGELLTAEGEITLNDGRETVTLTVANTGDRPIQVGSHYHFFETNRALAFDRPAAYGHRLDIPAGTAVRFEPGESRTVRLVPIAGDRIVRGGNAWASGPVVEGRDLGSWE